MGAPQVEWGKRKRLELINLLGGKCQKCGTTEKLEVHHPNGRNYLPKDISSDTRVRIYFREYESGVPLGVLCTSCNKKKENQPQAEEESPF